MAYRPIGQEQLGSVTRSRSASSLDELDGLIDWKPVAVLLGPLYPATRGDSASRGSYFGDAVRARGGTPCAVATGMWGRDEAEVQARLKAWNQPIHYVRARIENIFGTWKRSCGLRRTRWRGLAKATAQVHLTTIAIILNGPGRSS